MLLRPINKHLVEDIGVQPIQGLTHSYGRPISPVGCVDGLQFSLRAGGWLRPGCISFCGLG